MDNVVYLHGQPEPITQFLRVGFSGHRRLEQLLSAGQLPLARIVIDAAAFRRQTDLVGAIQASGRELTLDTNAAELSSVGKFDGAVREAPWANPDGVLTPAHFGRSNDLDVLGAVARFAVEHRFQRVLAPAHLLTGVKDRWFHVDLEATRKLRTLLDMEGGKGIALDYPLLLPASVLNDPTERKALATDLTNLPIDSIWVRASGFGADATAAGVRKYIAALQDFVAIGQPIISDNVGGMAALAVVALGSACGVAHGAAEKERFDASDWNRPRNSKQRGGGGYTVLLPGIDRLLKRTEAEVLIMAPHARRLVSCTDRTCCPNGFEDTLKDPRGHYLRQRAAQCQELSSIPDAVKAQHFLDKILTEADRKARQIAKLRISDERLSAALHKNLTRLDRLRAVLEDLHGTGLMGRSKVFPTARVRSHSAHSRDRN
jgi:hypothetical protein